MVTKSILEKILPDWEVTGHFNSFQIIRHSPAGEDLSVSLQGDDLDDMSYFVHGYWEDFDPEDHAAQIYHAKHYGTPEEQRFFASAPDSLEALLEDARWIDNIYYAVYETLCKAYEEGVGDGDDE